MDAHQTRRRAALTGGAAVLGLLAARGGFAQTARGTVGVWWPKLEPVIAGETAAAPVVHVDWLSAAGNGRAYTLSAWVHPGSINRQSVVGQARRADDWNSPRTGLLFSDFGTAAFAHFDAAAPAANLALVGSTALRPGTWTLLTATHDGEQLRLYVDGRLDAAKPWRLGVGWSGPLLRFAQMREFDPPFIGQLGEVSLHDRALSADEVAHLHRLGRRHHPASPDTPGPSAAVRSSTMQARRHAQARAWETFPATTLDELVDYRTTGGVPLTAYGGRSDGRLPATGYFHARQVDGRWWLVDPAGGQFLHAAVVAVAPGRSATVRASFEQRYGTPQRWCDATVELLKAHGFNGTGAWSEVDLLRSRPQKLAYTVMTNFLADFARTRGLTRPAVGHSGYVGESLPVFLPDFEAHCEQYARQHLAKYQGDPWLLGSFSDNELLTPDLKKYLGLDPQDPRQAPNRDAAVQWLASRLGRTDVSAADVTWALDLEFQGHVFERYFSVVSRAVKKVLPNHLYLGSRLNTERDKINPHTWRAAGRYVDVIALNLYRTWTPDPEQIANWNTWSGRPVIITEWYVKGDDVGLPNITGAGWIVPTQADRGRFYQQFALKLIASRGIVGWHWFKYMDNDPTDLAADPSNRDANKGIVQLDHEPYAPLMNRMKALNAEIYPLADYFDRRAAAAAANAPKDALR